MRIRALLYRCSLFPALLGLALPLNAQQDEATLGLQTASGQDTFHIGERIPLKLTFNSPNDTDYLIVRLIQGRGGEFDCNRFEVVNPGAGWSDPFEMYYKQDLLWSGHGWPPRPLEQSKPVEASVDLNEWVRFDQPGDYTVRVTSNCVINSHGNSPHPLTQTIDLHIVPATPEWQHAKFPLLKPNLDLLDHPERRGTELQFLDARADLKYLATPEAIDELTYRLRSEKYNFADQCSMALMGLPPAMRETAIVSMNRRIEEPDFPINQFFVSAWTFLHVIPGSDKDGIRKQQEDSKPALWSAIFSAVTKKEPAARAQTIQTLLQLGRNLTTAPEIRQQMSSLLKLSFLDLDRSSQVDDLRSQWDRLRSPEFVPVLQTLARLPVQNDSDLQVNIYDVQQIKGLALKRWYELDPEAAHQEIMAQIGSATPSLAAQSIAFLPPEQFPQFETLWAQALLDTKSQLRERALGSLLVRFGTGAASQQMIFKLADGVDYPCDGHIVALAYLARFDPAVAQDKLRDAFTGKCGGQLLQWISELSPAPVLNEQAVENLKSANVATVRDALQYLISYGRKEDEAPLWQRYVEWTSEYAGKPELLDKAGPMNWDKNLASSVIGEELGRALLASQGWFADADLTARVMQRCVGEQMCNALKAVVRSAASPYRILIPDPSMPTVDLVSSSVNVAQYGPRTMLLFEEKVSQFPRGSRFLLFPSYHPGNSDQQALLSNVQTILNAHGMLLVPSPK